ncbi:MULTISPECIES: hypothetical protein [unclassified Bradyrhizobium]
MQNPGSDAGVLFEQAVRDDRYCAVNASARRTVTLKKFATSR